jgi:phosphoenolpyruvate synthase/pyruvate phosphate dikinase
VLYFTKAFDELMANVGILESHYHDMQDIEFTIQEKKLWMLQTRGGKRTGAAAIKIALDLVEQGLATKDQAIKTVHSAHLKQLLHPQVKRGLSLIALFSLSPCFHYRMVFDFAFLFLPLAFSFALLSLASISFSSASLSLSH